MFLKKGLYHCKKNIGKIANFQRAIMHMQTFLRQLIENSFRWEVYVREARLVRKTISDTTEYQIF